MLRVVEHRPAEWTRSSQEGRLPRFDPSARLLYPIYPDSRLQPVRLEKDGSSARGYRSFGGASSDSRPQLPSVSDILKTSPQPQRPYHRQPSAHRVVAMEPFGRGSSKPSSFPSGMAPDETARLRTSPSPNISVLSSTSCELEGSVDRPGVEMPKGASTSRRHTALGTDVEGSFRRHELGDHNEGNQSSHPDRRRSPASTRHPPPPRSREGSAAIVDPSRLSTTEKSQQGQDGHSNRRDLSGGGYDIYERSGRKSQVPSNYLHPGREPKVNQHAVSAYPATSRIAYALNQRNEPIRQQRLPQLKDALIVRRRTMPAGTPNSNSNSVHSQAEDNPPSLIWDGNRFLPRLVKAETVPGKGLCYFYDDGSHCKANIDGEDVNPSWGVTKAGKPRKRLAVACITCREKKIKCDPDYPKCQQCVKFDRVCMFKNAARAAQILKEAHTNRDSSNEGAEAATRPPQARLSGQHMESQQVDVHSASDDSPTEAEPTVSKKRKSILDPDAHESFANSYDQLLMEGILGQPTKKRRAASPAAVLQMLSALRSSNCWGEFDWETDPYEAHPELVDHLMDLYFKHINTSIYCMFPQKPFRRWLRSGEKSSDDRMLIYAMLTLASRFSTDPDRRVLAKNLQATAQYAIEHRHGKFSLQLVQSRLIFSLYCFASNKLNEAYEYSGAGIRAALAMKLNIDNGASDFPGDDSFEYGLSRHAIAECRRRTFWSAYLMDRFNGFSSGRAGLISNDDVFVRLPCRDRLFEDQEEVSNPFFDKATADNTDLAQSSQEEVDLGPMAYLVKISFIWGDALAEIYRSANRPNGASTEAYEAFYSKTQRRLSRWLTDLPSDLIYTEENMSLSSKSGHLGTFLTMHSLHHATRMKLSRYARLDLLPRERIMENLQQLDKHAREQLQMMICFRRELQLEGPLGTPFTGYATSSACDILSAKIPSNKYSEIVGLLSQGSSVLESLQDHWHSCKKHRTWMLRRIERLEKTEAGRPVNREDAEGGIRSHSPITLECIPQPMEAPFCAVDDIAYQVDSDIYREAIMNQPHTQNSHYERRRTPVYRKASSTPSVLESSDEKESETKD